MTTLRVLTWNVSYEHIELANVPPWPERFHAVGSVLAHADIVALQEVTQRQIDDRRASSLSASRFVPRTVRST
ncbi:MAG: endonuclease/exonuclease/phosphatase family protein [Microthrixaceae bacterium]